MFYGVYMLTCDTHAHTHRLSVCAVTLQREHFYGLLSVLSKQLCANSLNVWSFYSNSLIYTMLSVWLYANCQFTLS